MLRYFHQFFIIFPNVIVGASIENAVCLDLMVACLKQQMIEDVYPAKVFKYFNG